MHIEPSIFGPVQLHRGTMAGFTVNSESMSGAPVPLDRETPSRLRAETAVHARRISSDLSACLRSGEAEGVSGGQDAAVHGGVAQATESGSSVLGTEEPSRPQTPTSAPTEVRTRAVLPCGRGPKSQATDAVLIVQARIGNRGDLRRK